MRRSWVVACVVAAGCAKPDPAAIVRPLESTLGAAVPAAYFATISMAALDGRPSPCANVVTPSGSGGPIRVDVSLGAGCPKMFGNDESGTLVVTGTWTPSLATFVMSFTGLTYGGHEMIVVGIGSMTVAPQGSHLVIAYAAENIMVAGDNSGAGSQQVVWTVDVDTAGTDDPSDDTIAVSGGDQSLLAIGGNHGNADITQVALADAVFAPGCRKNPGSGIAAVQRAGTLGGGWLLFDFHSPCDGQTDITGAMAPYELLLGDSVPLGFLQ